MNTTTIKLFENCKILQDKNFVVENIETYLSTLTQIVRTNFQYVKPQLFCSIKINLSSYQYLTLNSVNNYNYVSITDSDTTSYYFVIGRRWKADSTLELDLKLDTINTFTTENNKIVFNAKTRILREHRDRYQAKIGGNIYTRKVDYISEGITPELVKKNLNDTYITPFSSLDWYLIYANQNNPSESLENPVRCLICASEKINIKLGETTATFNPDDFVEDRYYYVDLTQQPSFSFNDDYGVFDYSQYQDVQLISFQKDNNSILVAMWKVVNGYVKLITAVNRNIIEFTNVNGLKYYNGFNIIDLRYEVVINNSQELNVIAASGIYQLNSINEIDRTNAKLIKIIKLPYPPFHFNYDIDSDTYQINDSVSIGNEYNILELVNLNTKFDYVFNANEYNPFKEMNVSLATDFNQLIDKNINYESKLFHSDFYQPKFFYDSFGFTFELEKLISTAINATFTIGYLVASTINSRFMFYFDTYKRSLDVKEDYDKYLIITRNNEEVLYNSAYINYIRSGYNYDVKSKNLSVAGTIGTLAISTIGTIIGAATGNVALTATSATALVSNLYGSINSIAQQENTFEAKQTQLKNQSTSVATNDDIDLMSKYTKNKLAFNIYIPSEQMRKALFDLFYYAGYKTDYCGIPNTSTRRLFNFLQCEAVFDSHAKMNEDMLEDLTTKYSNGITILHNLNNHWEFEQVHENWETNIESL